jgi:hypothetical protein
MVAFLISTLLLPTSSSSSSSDAPDITPAGPTTHKGGSRIPSTFPHNTSTPSTAVSLHAGAASPTRTLPAGLGSTSTFPLALTALRTHHVVLALIESLVAPHTDPTQG